MLLACFNKDDLRLRMIFVENAPCNSSLFQLSDQLGLKNVSLLASTHLRQVCVLDFV